MNLKEGQVSLTAKVPYKDCSKYLVSLYIVILHASPHMRLNIPSFSPELTVFLNINVQSCRSFIKLSIW